MPFEAMVVSIIAMVLGYKLLARLLPQRTTCNGKNCRHHRTRNAAPMDYEEQEALRARAEELRRRVETLEEIIAADTTVRSET